MVSKEMYAENRALNDMLTQPIQYADSRIKTKRQRQRDLRTGLKLMISSNSTKKLKVRPK